MGTTSFAVVNEDISYHRDIHLDPMQDRDIESNDIVGIKDFLAKPMPVQSGTISTADTWGANKFSLDLYTLFTSQTIWLNKIQGFLSFRGDVKLRLVVNATPFHSGLLKLSYFPCENILSNEALMHTYNRMTISQLPGPYLDISNNAVELTVPYVSPTSHIERDNPSGGAVSWGKIYLDIMEILRTGTGSSTINYTLWMSLENVELSGQIQPQMASKGRKLRGNVVDIESNEGQGPLTKILGSGANLAKSVSSIPSLAPLATPVYWALAAARAAAQTLGWSKPTITSAVHYHALGNGFYSNNCDGGDTSLPLSLSADNKIATILDATPGGQDEMSMAYINSRWSYWLDFQFGHLKASGDQLFNTSIIPTTMVQSFTLGAVSVFTSPPCSIASQFTQYYRGSFDVRLRAIKTGYHTGTIAVVFVPGKNVTTPSYNDTAYCYRQIIDIQDGNEWCFNLPYLIPQSYLENTESIGSLIIYCVNPIIAPSTVSADIDMFMEIRGGSDLEYQVPRGLFYSSVVPQGIDVANNEETICTTLGAGNHDADVHHAQLAMGEKLTSLLKLCKMQSQVASIPSLFSLGAANLTLATHRFGNLRYNAGASVYRDRKSVV